MNDAGRRVKIRSYVHNFSWPRGKISNIHTWCLVRSLLKAEGLVTVCISHLAFIQLHAILPHNLSINGVSKPAGKMARLSPLSCEVGQYTVLSVPDGPHEWSLPTLSFIYLMMMMMMMGFIRDEGFSWVVSHAETDGYRFHLYVCNGDVWVGWVCLVNTCHTLK